MQKCKYATAHNSKYPACKECGYAYFSKCPKFIAAYNAEAVLPLKPFGLVRSVSFDGKASWSRDINRAKTVAYRMHQREGKPIVKLTLRNVIDFLMDGGLELDGKVVYVEVQSRPIQDTASVTSFLSAFVEKMALCNTYVSIFVSMNSGVFPDKSIAYV